MTLPVPTPGTPAVGNCALCGALVHGVIVEGGIFLPVTGIFLPVTGWRHERDCPYWKPHPLATPRAPTLAETIDTLRAVHTTIVREYYHDDVTQQQQRALEMAAARLLASLERLEWLQASYQAECAGGES